MSKIVSSASSPASENGATSVSHGGHPSAPKKDTQPSCASPAAHEKSQLFPPPESSSACRLLAALWRSPDRSHQIGILDRQNHKFKNLPVDGVADAIAQAQKLSNAGHEVYFACAEYLTPDSRAAANASGACGFWLDIDCGEDKVVADKGYSTVGNAEEALMKFCQEAELPKPTYIIHSGGGLHAHWVINSVISRETWLLYARQFKAVTKACGFRADDSRTADIASVLRVPGTLNYKYFPPRPVSLIHASDEFIDTSVMLEAIDAAYDRLCGAVDAKPPGCPSTAKTDSTTNLDESVYGPPDLVKLRSALATLDPDCDEETWKLRRLATLALAAHDHPEGSIALYALARSWSSGELRGEPSLAWLTPGGNGRTGEEVFDEVWDRFLNTNYTGTPVTVRTIYYDAMEVGWDHEDSFEVIDDGEDA